MVETVTIHGPNGTIKEETVEATPVGPLFVHRPVASDKRNHHGYMVTQRRSGMCVASGFARKAEAVAAAERLCGIFDWSKSLPKSNKAKRALYENVRLVLGRATLYV